MKKLGTWCLVVMMVITLLSGCAKTTPPDTSPEYKFETDCQYDNAVSSFPYFLAESEDSFFYVDTDDYLHVVDKESNLDTIFCNKPNCLHKEDFKSKTEDEKKQCDAYAPAADLGGVAYYEGALYLITAERHYGEPVNTRVLRRYSLDGTGQKDIWELNFGKGVDTTFTGYFIHRGKVYFLVLLYDYTNIIPETGEWKYLGQYLYSYDLKTKRAKRLYQFDDEKYPYTHFNPYAIGDNIYMRCFASDSTNTNLLRYNISDGTLTELPYCKQVFLTGDSLVSYYSKEIEFLPEENKVLLDHWLTVSPLDETGETSHQTTDINERVEYHKQFQAQGHLLFAMDGMRDKYANEIRVYDFTTGEKIATLSLPNFANSGLRTISCSMSGQLYIYDPSPMDENGETEEFAQFFYCNISAIGTDDFRWYEVERVN